MSFAPPPVLVRLSRSDLDTANSKLRPLRDILLGLHTRWRERVFLRVLSNSEFVVLTAIVSRTLGWSKVLEVVTLSEFSDGIEGAWGPIRAKDGMPVFKGTGLTKKTVIKALSGLEAQGMIGRYPFPTGGRETYVYSPISAWALRTMVKKYPQLGPLPDAVLSSVRVDDTGAPLVAEWEQHFVNAFFASRSEQASSCPPRGQAQV